MGKDMNRLLRLLADTEAMAPGDKLSKLVEEDDDSELSEEMLDLVSAATGSDYEKFKRFLAVENDAADN